MGGSSIAPPQDIGPGGIIEFVYMPLPVSHRIDEIIPKCAVSQVGNSPIEPKPEIILGEIGVRSSKEILDDSDLKYSLSSIWIPALPLHRLTDDTDWLACNDNIILDVPPSEFGFAGGQRESRNLSMTLSARRRISTENRGLSLRSRAQSRPLSMFGNDRYSSIGGRDRYSIILEKAYRRIINC